MVSTFSAVPTTVWLTLVLATSSSIYVDLVPQSSTIVCKSGNSHIAISGVPTVSGVDVQLPSLSPDAMPYFLHPARARNQPPGPPRSHHVSNTP
ncbi:hypothetical protein ONZ45_g14244 [Pleurotus djamor]|nr:hypothetical protein ONZ45_g14244 [Pleurotus djamor]